MKVVYTVEAVEDLKRLRQFIAEHNPAAARRIAAELVAKVKLLADFPAIGVPVAMAPLPESLRDMVFGNYVVRYSVHSNAIIILRL